MSPPGSTVPVTDTGRRAREQPTARGGNWRILAVVLVGAFMALLDTTIVNVALPSIAHGVVQGLGAGVYYPAISATIQWLFSERGTP
jgi:hypothetical protein